MPQDELSQSQRDQITNYHGNLSDTRQDWCSSLACTVFPSLHFYVLHLQPIYRYGRVWVRISIQLAFILGILHGTEMINLFGITPPWLQETGDALECYIGARHLWWIFWRGKSRVENSETYFGCKRKYFINCVPIFTYPKWSLFILSMFSPKWYSTHVLLHKPPLGGGHGGYQNRKSVVEQYTMGGGCKYSETTM